MPRDGPDGHGDEPRQVHRLPHLLGDLQAGLDQPGRRRVRLVQQRRDPARAGVPAPLRGPGAVEGRLDAEQARPAGAARRRPGASGCCRMFANPVLPELEDYYEPWTYDYETLIDAPLGDDFPVARPKSLITGKDTKITWWANWDDDLGGAPEHGHLDPIVEQVRHEAEDRIKFEFEQTFMFYLPRICEHCLNPACMASCPSGAIYKRVEDGIVLVDQDRAAAGGVRDRLPVQEDLLQPQDRQGREVHVLLPAGGGRPADGLLGDLRRPAALPRAVPVRRRPGDRPPRPPRTSRTSTRRSSTAARPDRPRGASPAAARQGIPEDWMDAARRSPVYALAKVYRVALPLHPEYRTMPMVWYVPPLSPVRRRCCATRATTARTPATCSAPSTRCGSRWSTWPSCSPPATPTPSRGAGTLAAMRSYMRERHPRRRPADEAIADGGRDDRRRDLRDVPAAGDRQVRGALRHPEGARGAGPRARGDGLLAGLRGRAGDGRDRTVRRGVRPATRWRWRPSTPEAAADLRGRPDPGTCAAG